MNDRLAQRRADAFALVRRDAAPRYSLVEAHLREQISAGTLRPNDRLPNETDLGVQYGVSRSVIRQALDNLERDGLVVRMRAKGTFITEPDLSLPADLLSSFSQELELHGIMASSRVLAYEILPADPSIAKLLEIDEGTRIPYVERLRLGDGDVLGWDATWIHPSMEQSVAHMDFEHDVLFDSYRAAGRIVHSVERRVRAVTAGKDLAAKLLVKEGASLLEIARLVRDISGVVLDRQVRLYRGDRFSLALDAPGAGPSPDISLNPRLRFDG
ncbi:GntR family transcriptional regulator [Microbacterium alcoholitolerans]|uniref:GntR family transcriptional regulator n=1 Tax=unclassified Microbacterium TaxID=2609290 RepID=UPI003D166F92